MVQWCVLYLCYRVPVRCYKLNISSSVDVNSHVCLQVDLEPTGKLRAVIDLNGCLTEGSYPL